MPSPIPWQPSTWEGADRQGALPSLTHLLLNRKLDVAHHAFQCDRWINHIELTID
jgi:hypothetical protein